MESIYTAYTENDINELYTKCICKYINRGYKIKTNTMDVRYCNERCHVDLAYKSNKSIYRVWLLNKKDYTDSNRTYDTLSLVVKEYPITSYLHPDKGVTVEERTFYKLNTNKHSIYFNTIDGIRRAISLKEDRIRLREENNAIYDECSRTNKFLNKDTLPASIKEGIMKKIRSNYGMKRAHTDVIKSIHLYQGSNNHLVCCVLYDNDRGRRGTVELM